MPIRTAIAGLGTYSPERSISIRERERTPFGIRLPIGRVTGIESVRIAAGDEFAIDLARKAAQDCLSRADVSAAEVGLLISCGICRYDLPDYGHVFEPSTAARLSRQLGLTQALSFDVSNACAGMFTGIYLADAFLRAGRCRYALVASGEFISHMAETALAEIQGLFDPRMACLTLGDGGAAVLLTLTEQDCGFEAMSLYSKPEHSQLCTARPSKRCHGGAIMYTDSAGIADKMLGELEHHVPRFLAAQGSPAVNWLVPHQTSLKSVKEGCRRFKRSLGERAFDSEQLLLSLGHRGNTASTSHMLALRDGLSSGKVQDGDRVLFSVNASCLVVGSFLYRTGTPKPEDRSMAIDTMRARICGIGIIESHPCSPHMPTFSDAVTKALEEAQSTREDVDLMIFAGVYRDNFIMEPSVAALLAKQCGIACGQGEGFLCFDLFAGENGLLYALEVSEALLATGKYKTAMILCGDTDPNVACSFAPPLGILQTAAALIVRAGGEAATPASVLRFETDLVRHTRQRQGETFVLETGVPASGEAMHAALDQSISYCNAAALNFIRLTRSGTAMTGNLVRTLLGASGVGLLAGATRFGEAVGKVIEVA